MPVEAAVTAVHHTSRSVNERKIPTHKAPRDHDCDAVRTPEKPREVQ